MKKFILLFSLLVVIFQNASSQNSNGGTTRLADQLQRIDKIKDQIKQNIKKYKRVEKRNDESAFREDYFEEHEVKLIHIISKEIDVEKKVAWYFDKGKLIYSDKIWTDTKTNTLIETEKLYFNNEKLICWIAADGKPVDPNSEGFKSASKELEVFIERLKNGK